MGEYFWWYGWITFLKFVFLTLCCSLTLATDTEKAPAPYYTQFFQIASCSEALL